MQQVKTKFLHIKEYFITNIIILFIPLLSAANPVIDSLLTTLQNNSTNIETLIKLSGEYERINTDSSLVYIEEALTVALKKDSKDLLPQIYFQTSKILYAQKQYNQSKNFGITAFNLLEKRKNHPDIGSNSYWLGNTYRRLEIYDSALFYYDYANNIFNLNGDRLSLSRSLNNQGLIFYNTGQYKKAIEAYKASLIIKQNLGLTKSSAITLYNIGNVYKQLGQYDSAISNYQSALELFEEVDDLFGKVSCIRDKAVIYELLLEFDKALEMYQEALIHYNELNIPVELANIYDNLGILYTKIFQNKAKRKYADNWEDSIHQIPEIIKDSNIIKAIKYYTLAKNTRDEINNVRDIARSYNNLGTLYYSINEFNQALTNYKNALTTNIDLDNVADIINNKHGIGKCYFKLGDIDKALIYLNESLELSIEIGSIEMQKNNYEVLSEVYEKTTDYKKSIYYHRLYSQLKDSLFTISKQKQIFDIQTKYETEKKEQEIVNLNISNKLNTATIKNQRNAIFIFSLGLLLILSAAFLLLKLYQQKRKANSILENQNRIISKQNVEIKDSIQYAQRIQAAVLPRENFLKENLSDSFIFFKPKDIVSGDFYWMTEQENKIIVCAADCTGHGVPGAFMSMLGVSFLNKIVNERNIIEPNLILNKLRDNIINSLKQKGISGENKDGMDIALCSIDNENLTCKFAGANNPLYIIRKNKTDYEVIEKKGDRMPVSIHIDMNSFKQEEFQLEKGDSIYLFSDGFVDQFGGPKGRKFMKKNFKNLLLNFQDKPMNDQKNILEKTINDWINHSGDSNEKFHQIDDIIIIGVKI